MVGTLVAMVEFSSDGRTLRLKTLTITGTCNGTMVVISTAHATRRRKQQKIALPMAVGVWIRANRNIQ